MLRWFSIVSLLALVPVAAATGFVLSYFITEETLERDAILTAQFIRNCIEVEGRHAGLGRHVSFSEFLDERAGLGADPAYREAVEFGRHEILDHLRSLPDVLLATLFAPDGRIIWSSNPDLVGMTAGPSDELERAFKGEQVVRHHHASQGSRAEQDFPVKPQEFFVENYIPLRNARGDVVLVAELYKEPKSLVATIERGRRLMWGTTAMAGALVFLALFGIVRTGSTMLRRQQAQLAEMEALAFMGEMSSAVAHGLRNPLASIRSSAELALGAGCEPVEKNARDIIGQVDFLSRWVRELLIFTQPVTGGAEPVDLAAILEEVLASFEPACRRAGIRVHREGGIESDLAAAVRVLGNPSLTGQVLHSVISNAVEAMPQGGELRIAMAAHPSAGRLLLTVADTGVGMSEKQLALAFKPFHTTKRQGLGVGLAIVKRAMDRFGGAVALSSREGEGTEVRLEFRIA